MTEAEWSNAAHPQRMLDHIRGRHYYRKLCLFACAECRRQENNIISSRFRDALGVVERRADGELSGDEWDRAKTLIDSTTHLRGGQLSQARLQGVVKWLMQPVDSIRTAVSLSIASKPKALLWQANILRDIFGNPFRPVAFDPAWRTLTAVGLAQAIYDERAFDRLPILADALQDAGCEDADVLSHCHGDGPHVRGCWVVDLVLG